MDKDKFVDAINFCKQLYKEQEMFNDVLHNIDKDFGGGYIHTKSIDYILEMLRYLTNDKYAEIAYYAWELDFGDKYEDGIITDKDNNIIKLATPEDLYNLILEDNKEC